MINKYILLAFSAGVINIFANPQNPLVINGEANFESNDHQMMIYSKDKTIIDWDNFSIASSEVVKFILNPHDRVLNRVKGFEKSHIDGLLQSLGTIYLINPNGVVIGKKGVIDVAGFIGSTQDITNKDFIDGSSLFFKGESKEPFINLGRIQTQSGDILLVAHHIRNEGDIESFGDVYLASGYEVLYKFSENHPFSIGLCDKSSSPQIENFKMISANKWYDSPVVLEKKGGRLLIGSDQKGLLLNQGQLLASDVIIEVSEHYSAGTINAENIDISVNVEIEMAKSNILGKVVNISGKESLFSSGNVKANSIELRGETIGLSAAIIDASRKGGGGSVIVGGKSKDDKNLSKKITLGQSSLIKADALESGIGGEIILFSSDETVANGLLSAEGFEKGGFIEISSKDVIKLGGTQIVKGLDGKNGTILLDPKNITVSSDVDANYPAFELINPNPTQNFAVSAPTVLPNGNIVIRNPTLQVNSIANAGGVYLFDGNTGALISALYGTNVSDQVGGNILQLPSGNFVVISSPWDQQKGAATWIDQTTGLNGSVNSANSLVGSSTGDRIGDIRSVLPNGNYILQSFNWSGGRGAVTWGNGSGGTVGVVSSENSLIGSSSGDSVGFTTGLSNGNYVVFSTGWSGGRGAVTWGNGNVGTVGILSSGNSLIGSVSGDRVGDKILVLGNGNYVVGSTLWNQSRGAVTWGNGSGGTVGIVSSGNSFLGLAPDDRVGFNLIKLANNNYLILSPSWNLGRGAVTWCNGFNSLLGNVSSLNSLVGSEAGDRIGTSFLQLSNGNYVTSSLFWSGGRGAATWGNGSGGTVGVVSSGNSLVGSTSGDNVALTTGLSNGNYVVRSTGWSGNRGAVTWGDGNGGTVGVVSSGNSLVGSVSDDRVGITLLPLNNGHYVVGSTLWNQSRGAVTWGNGSGGTVGIVSSGNSLVGSTSGDNVGLTTGLSNGNYVVRSTGWSGNRGAVTWGDGNGGTVGVVSSGNSLIGSVSGDRVGIFSVPILTNGNYVVLSSGWSGNRGAATWGNGNGGTVGVVSSGNSLVGSSIGDLIGSNSLRLSNGNYVVSSSGWSGGRGAVTWGNGSGGTVGIVSSGNSLVGSTSGDIIGAIQLIQLSNSNFVAIAPFWNNRRGAVTLGNGNSGTFGVIGANNSFIGSNIGDRIGEGTFIDISSGTSGMPYYAFSSNRYNLGSGSVTWADINGPSSGVLNYTNSYLALGGGTNSSTINLASNRINNSLVFNKFNNNTKVFIGLNNPNTVPYSFGNFATLKIHSSNIENLLTSGNVELQANNDIEIKNLNVSGTNTLSLLAGRTVNLESINLQGDLNVYANTTGVDLDAREVGSGSIIVTSVIAKDVLLNIQSGANPGPIVLNGIATAENLIASAPSIILNNNSSITVANDLTLNGPLNGQKNLDLVVNGNLYLNGTIGSTTKLAALNLSGSNVYLPSNVGTSGNIVITGPSTLVSNTTLTSIGGSITLDNVNGSHNLNLNGETLSFNGPIGGIDPLTSFQANGSQISLPSVLTTTGNIVITGPSTLVSNTTLTSTGGSITLDNVNGSHNLNLNGETLSFNGPIGGVNPLTSFQANGSQISLPSALTTTGNILITGPSTLGSNTTLTSTGGNITLGIVNGANNNLTTYSSSGYSGFGNISSVQNFLATSRTLTLNGTTSANQNITLTPSITNTDGIPNGFIRLYGPSITANNINLSTAGRGQVLKTATIYGNPSGGNLTLTGNVNIGPFEALTVFGDLTINGDNVTVGDIIALGDIQITASTTTINCRESGELLSAFGTLYTSDTTHLLSESTPNIIGNIVYNPVSLGAPDPEIMSYTSEITRAELSNLLVYEGLILNYDFKAPIVDPIVPITKQQIERGQTISDQSISSLFVGLGNIVYPSFSLGDMNLNGIKYGKNGTEFSSDPP